MHTAMLANAHCFYCLWEARTSSATFLRAISGEHSDAARQSLETAAATYDAIVAEMTRPGLTRVAPMPGMLSEGQSWSQEQRNAQADILEAVFGLERRAIGGIEATLGAMS